MSLVFLLEISDLQQTYVHYLQLDNQEIIHLLENPGKLIVSVSPR